MIPLADLRLVMVNLGDKLTQIEVQEILNEADMENNNQVNYDKFVKVMMSR